MIRSVDGVYEIIFYSLFFLLVETMTLKVEILIAAAALPLIKGV
ncbi:HaeII family restriction endonuclease [Prevotella fusca]